MNQVTLATRAAAMLLVLSAALAANAAVSYTVTAALRIDDLRTTAVATNASGQVVGFHSYTVTSTMATGRAAMGTVAFLTDADGATPLDVAPFSGLGTATSGPCKGLAYSDGFVAVNAGGSAVGASTVLTTVGTKTVPVIHAVLYAAGTLKDLGTLGGVSSVATGINAAGLVVGASDVGKGKVHAFSSNGTTMTDIGTLGGNASEAVAVSDAGTIVGNSTLAAKGGTHPFSYASGTMTDLGLPTGFASAAATGISTSGLIVGTGELTRVAPVKGKRPAPPTIQSFLYNGTTFTNLGSLYTDKAGNATPVHAAGVNSSGLVVGDTVDATGKPRGFVYSGGTLTDLNTALPSAYAANTITAATSISDAGYVTATAVDASGKGYALLLKLG